MFFSNLKIRFFFVKNYCKKLNLVKLLTQKSFHCYIESKMVQLCTCVGCQFEKEALKSIMNQKTTLLLQLQDLFPLLYERNKTHDFFILHFLISFCNGEINRN